MTTQITEKSKHNHPLRRVRESLGFTLQEVAAHCNWSPEYLRELEQADDIDDTDAIVLSDTYGVDVVMVLEGHHGELPPKPMRALLRAQSDALDAGTRFAISEAAAVSVDASRLRKLLNERVGWGAITQFKNNTDYTHPSQGMPEKLAQLVRQRAKLPNGPVHSMTSLIRSLGIQIIVADFAAAIDAVSFATSRTGGVIVLNRGGIHASNAFGRRVTLAHELCHVLFDRSQMRDMKHFCAVTRQRKRTENKRLETFEAIERRARAFAMYLLVPVDDLRDLWRQIEHHPTHRRVRIVMEYFGVGYEAARAHLDNAELLSLTEPLMLVETDTPLVWEERDALPLHEGEQLNAIPLVRRGAYLDLVLRAWQREVLAESGAREALRVSRLQWPQVSPHLTRSSTPGHSGGWLTSASILGVMRSGG